MKGPRAWWRDRLARERAAGYEEGFAAGRTQGERAGYARAITLALDAPERFAQLVRQTSAAVRDMLASSGR